MTAPTKAPTVAKIIATELGLEGDYTLRFDRDRNEFSLGLLAPTDGTCYTPMTIPLSATKEIRIGMTAKYDGKKFSDHGCTSSQPISYPSPEKLDRVRQALKAAGFPSSESIPQLNPKNKKEIRKLAAQLKEADRRALEPGDQVQVRIRDNSPRVGDPTMISVNGTVGRIEEDGSFYVWTKDDFFFRGEDQGRVVRVYPLGQGKFEFRPFGSEQGLPMTLNELSKKISK